MNELASNYGRGMEQSLGEIWDAIDSGEEYEGQDAREYLDEMVLEIVNHRGAPLQIVLTVGGPDSRIMATLNNVGEVLHAHLATTWDGEDVRTSGAIRRTADYFAELLED